MRALVAGWFTFDEVIATVGDLVGAQVTAQWLAAAGWACDTAVAPYMGDGVDWRRVRPANYDLLVFSTGPLKPSPLIDALLDRFEAVPAWAVNVSVLDAQLAGRFERVWERDSPALTRPDLAFSAPGAPLPPVVGVAYAPPQREYADGRHEQVARTVADWLRADRLAVIELDMDMYAEHRWPREASQVQALIERVDVVVSMRLHGTVLALRHGRPVIAVDPIGGGGKVARQARAVDWPCLLLPDELDLAALRAALTWCLTPQARERAAQAGRVGAAGNAALLGGLSQALSGGRASR